MNAPVRRPETKLTAACPAYKDAIERYERALTRNDARAMDEAWLCACQIAQAFWQGAEYAWAHEAAVAGR